MARRAGGRKEEGRAEEGGMEGENSREATPLKLKLKFSVSPTGKTPASTKEVAMAEAGGEEEATMSESESTKSIMSDDESEEENFNEDAVMYADDIEVVYGKSSRRPERLTARQRAMVYGEDDGSQAAGQAAGASDQGQFNFKGGIDSVFAKPKKQLTAEELMKKAELNEERRRRAVRMKKEQQVAAQKAIREGKGAKAKREDKINEKRRERLKKRRMGGKMESDTVRVSYKSGGNTVTWSEDGSLPDLLNQPRRGYPSRVDEANLITVPLDPKKWSSVKCGSVIELKGEKRTVKSINRKGNVLVVY
uniref:INO80 complex subunit B-like conserved region domain-containing protein n=2 Tax=Chloropicon primus TaxID=1764295 RepID=A0A7S2T3F6_9CHLO|mmetsp:Transcript_3439/g.9631  ORF Transcript_3439/g.9631 Transcript_3439/m.9631 type:complete len:307 (+) Transcript_3439:179-1099(+)